MANMKTARRAPLPVRFPILLYAACCLGLAACDREDKGPGRLTGSPAAATAAAETGLDFPSNGQSSADIRFRFTAPNLLPMYPATYVWRYQARQQTGRYALFFWGPDAPFYGINYYGPRPYPDGADKSAGTTHKWSISAAGEDLTAAVGGVSTQLGYGTWKTQAFRAYDNGTYKVHEYYWDLPDLGKVIRQYLPRSYGASPPTNAALTFGAAPGDPWSQRLSGLLRGMQIYKTRLSDPDLLAEIGSPRSTAAGSAGLWYLNLNPTPDDISDKSGQGHHPAWAASGRPGLWTGDGSSPPPPPPPVPAPTVSLAANPSSIAKGSASTLSWSSSNASSCRAGGSWSGNKALSGSQSTGPLSANATYTLTCTGDGGSASASATVTVSSAPAPTVTLGASPSSVAAGGASTLTWSSTNATSCNASGGWSGTKALSGSQSTGPLSATATYTLTCTGTGGSASRSATVTVAQSGGGTTGLDFPSNGSQTNDVRFRFRGSALIPMYPATYIWRVNLRRQAGYYTTFFWGPDGSFTGQGYYGCHPYPDGEPKNTSTSHKWELSINGWDPVTDANGHSTQLGYDTWKTQAMRVWDNGERKIHEFYWDLPDTTKVIRVDLDRSYGPPSNPALTFGTAPWAPASEHLSGILRGIQLYSAHLPMASVLAEAGSPLSTPAGSASIWYLNLNPTPTDISDKSGKGHHPEWVTTLRPALWTGP